MVNVIWKPIPNTSQELALDSPANETLFWGTRGPGKTDAQLMRFRRRVGIGYGEFWRGVIFDRAYKNLDDVVSKSKRWFLRFNDGCRFLGSKGDYKWVWETGEELLFRVVKKDSDYWDYHGQEFPFIGWNELTKFPTPDLYDLLMSCNRSSFLPEKDNPNLPPIPLEVFSTTNPKGPGKVWVKRKFIDCAKPGEIVKKETVIFNPATKQEEPVITTQVAIFGSYKENKYLSPVYIATLKNIKDEGTRKAWEEGSWECGDDGLFGSRWRPEVHIKDRFAIPAGWRLDRSFDWGSRHPFSVGWWAEANGEEAILPDGSKFCPKKGSLIRFYEWYGSESIGDNKGLGLGPTAIAEGIIEKEIMLMQKGWIFSQPEPGPADNQIGDEITVEDDTIEKKMAKVGVLWTKSNKSPGSRKSGVVLMKERLENSISGEGPGIYVMRNCQAFIQLVPALPPDPDDPDDADTDAEDHCWDETKYRILRGNDHYATNLKFLL